jgi:hypothetical protein
VPLTALPLNPISIIWTGLLYFGERVLREIRARRPTAITKVLLHPARVMEIRFTKPSMTYKSGQWLYLQVPAVSRFQWHPVSAQPLTRHLPSCALTLLFGGGRSSPSRRRLMFVAAPLGRRLA